MNFWGPPNTPQNILWFIFSYLIILFGLSPYQGHFTFHFKMNLRYFMILLKNLFLILFRLDLCYCVHSVYKNISSKIVLNPVQTLLWSPYVPLTPLTHIGVIHITPLWPPLTPLTPQRGYSYYLRFFDTDGVEIKNIQNEA